MTEKYLSVPQFASRLGVSRIAVFKKIKKGLLPALQIGRNWAVSEIYLDKYFLLSARKKKDRGKKVISEFAVSRKIQEEVLSRKEKNNSMESMGWD